MITQNIISVEKEILVLITPEQAWYYKIIPKSLEADEYAFFIDQENNTAVIEEELELIFNRKIKLESCESSSILKTLNKYYRKASSHGKIIQLQSSQTEDFLSKLIIESRQLNSSDIHIEVYEDKARVRIRIDGMLVERYQIGKNDYPALINKIKIKSHLDIAERRLPQDGRIQFMEAGYKIDIRVSVLPTLHGEKIVLRLLGNDAANIDIKNLGFTETELDLYLRSVKKPHGILLISGPTGSGKTTTLYATLKILNEEKRNILTVEDPIEYTLEGINQVQLKESIGLTFSSALRTFLRQDPDIIMLGEIRDGETAQMAIRAALTGHLVLSTIHTNSAWGTISRLVDMGVPAFLLSSTLNISVAQRLIRLLCEHCKKEEEFDPIAYPLSFKPKEKVNTHYVAGGCDHCYHTGYKGRRSVYEIIPIDYEISDKIKKQEFSISGLLHEKGIRSLSQNAFDLFTSGQTSMEEVYPLLMNEF